MAKPDLSPLFIDQFIDQMLEKAWFEPEDRDLLKWDIKPLLLDRITLSIVKELNDSQRDEFSVIYKTQDSAAMHSYLTTTLPQYEDIIAQAYLDFEQDYLSEFEE